MLYFFLYFWIDLDSCPINLSSMRNVNSMHILYSFIFNMRSQAYAMLSKYFIKFFLMYVKSATILILILINSIKIYTYQLRTNDIIMIQSVKWFVKRNKNVGRWLNVECCLPCKSEDITSTPGATPCIKSNLGSSTFSDRYHKTKISLHTPRCCEHCD